MTRKYSARRPSSAKALAAKTMNASLGDAEHGRDRVQREQDVGAADRDEHDEQRRRDAPAVDAGDQPPAVVVVA